jgi:hypothetical protein
LATLADSGVDLTPDTKVRIAMKVGRLPIESSKHEWLDSKRRIKHEGVVLTMTDLEHGGSGYAELDLNDKKDKATYEAFKAWVEDGRDPRIRECGVKELDRDEVPIPLRWWDSAHWKSLLADVSRGVRIMPDAAQRAQYIENCVRYEMQKGADARKGLIDGLMSIDLDVADENDPMSVPK